MSLLAASCIRGCWCSHRVLFVAEKEEDGALVSVPLLIEIEKMVYKNRHIDAADK